MEIHSRRAFFMAQGHFLYISAASYLRRLMPKHCTKIHAKSDFAI